MHASTHHPVVTIMAARFATRPADVVALQCVRAGVNLRCALAALRLASQSKVAK